MSTDKAANAELVRRIFDDGWANESFDFLLDATLPVVPFHYNGHTTQVTPESLPGLVRAWREAFPDLEMNIRHLVAQDDLVATSLTMRGTHEGAWLGVPPTGTYVAVEEMMFFRFEDGLLAEMWELFDEHGLKDQLLS